MGIQEKLMFKEEENYILSINFLQKQNVGRKCL